MGRSLARQLCKPYAEELTEEEMKLVFGGNDCVTPAGPCQLEGGGWIQDPRRIDCV